MLKKFGRFKKITVPFLLKILLGMTINIKIVMFKDIIYIKNDIYV